MLALILLSKICNVVSYRNCSNNGDSDKNFGNNSDGNSDGENKSDNHTKMIYT